MGASSGCEEDGMGPVEGAKWTVKRPVEGARWTVKGSVKCARTVRGLGRFDVVRFKRYFICLIKRV